MNGDEFWYLVDSTSAGTSVNRAGQARKIEAALQNMSLTDIASFRLHLDRNIRRSATFHFLVASFLVNSYVSDSVFHDFRIWVLLHGSKVYSKAIENPDIVSTLVDRRRAKNINTGNVYDVSARLWLQRGGGISEWLKKVGTFEDRPVQVRWPKDKQEFERKYPVLFRAFWNSNRMKAMHT